MASRVDNPELAFRRIMNHIAKNLTNADCESLQFVYKTKKPISQKEIPGLDVMEELLSKGIFSYQNSDGLGQALADIDRHDLASLLTEYQQGHVWKQSNKRSFKWKISKPVVSEETTKTEQTPQGGNMLPMTLMTALNINTHTQQLVEEATIEAQLSSKKELAAIADVKKNFDKLKESLKKAVSVVVKTHPIESRQVVSIKEETKLSSVTRKRPVPPPKPDKAKSSLPTSLTSPNLSSLASSGSGDITSSSSSSKSEDDIKVKYVGIKSPQGRSPEQETQTGDSGFNDDGSWGTALPVKTKSKVVYDKSFQQPLLASSEEPDYDQPWQVQETQYTGLQADNREEDHTYS